MFLNQRWLNICGSHRIYDTWYTYNYIYHQISRFLGKHEWILYEVETKSSPGFTAFLTGIGLHLEGDQKQIQTDSKEHAYGGFRVPRCCPKRWRPGRLSFRGPARNFYPSCWMAWFGGEVFVGSLRIIWHPNGRVWTCIVGVYWSSK